MASTKKERRKDSTTLAPGERMTASRWSRAPHRQLDRQEDSTRRPEAAAVSERERRGRPGCPERPEWQQAGL